LTPKRPHANLAVSEKSPEGKKHGTNGRKKQKGSKKKKERAKWAAKNT